MAKPKGLSWSKEVGHAGASRQERRRKFYERVAKLRTKTDPSGLLDNPSSQGLKSHADLQGLDPYSRKVKKGDSLSKYLRRYFSKNAGISDRKTRNKEVALSLFYLTQQKDAKGKPINVDRLIVGWTVEIEDGVIKMTNRKGGTILEANLRKPPAAATTKAKTKLSALGGTIGAAKELEFN